MEKRLYRSRTDRVIWGVCGGLAKYLGVDPVIVRVIVVLIALANGIGILAYIVMAIAVPVEGSRTVDPKETARENTEEMKATITELGQEIRSTLGKTAIEAEDLNRIRQRRRNYVGIALIVIGALFLLGRFNLFWWFNWGWMWPLLIIAAGLVLIFHTQRKRGN